MCEPLHRLHPSLLSGRSPVMTLHTFWATWSNIRWWDMYWALRLSQPVIQGRHPMNWGNLVVFQEYDVAVAAYHSQGDGQYSEYVRVSTLEGHPTAPPRSVSVRIVNSTSIQVSWLPPRQQFSNGIIRGYNIYVDTYDSIAPVFLRGTGQRSSLHAEGVARYRVQHFGVQFHNWGSRSQESSSSCQDTWRYW